MENGERAGGERNEDGRVKRIERKGGDEKEREEYRKLAC